MVLALLRFILAACLTSFWSVTCLVLLLIGPRRAWTFCRPRWGRSVMAMLGIDWHIHNPERLTRPSIFVCNHQSFLDVVLLPAMLPPETVIIAKREIRKVPVLGIAFANSGGLLIDRRNPRGAIASIREGIKKLPSGWSILIFPEGTRSKDGELRSFKKGCIHVALATKFPVIPIAVHGVRELTNNPTWRPRWLPRAGTIQIAVGEPIPTTDWHEDAVDQHLATVRTAVASELSRARAAFVPPQKNRPVASHMMETRSRPE